MLTNRMPLLEQLAAANDAKIAGWAKDAVGKLEAEIDATRKWDEEKDRERDERFEYD